MFGKSLCALHYIITRLGYLRFEMSGLSVISIISMREFQWTISYRRACYFTDYIK